jgi:anti-sigma regulatory factor (Ser/Thr protein kinase)
VSSLSLQLPFSANASRLARQGVTGFFAHNAVELAVENLLLIVSELVSNAVLHGAPPLSLEVSCDPHRVTIEVVDGDARTDGVSMGPIDRSAPGGRGLRIVDTLAERWGARASDAGKSVWASVRREQDPATAATRNSIAGGQTN